MFVFLNFVPSGLVYNASDYASTDQEIPGSNHSKLSIFSNFLSIELFVFIMLICLYNSHVSKSLFIRVC